jgi:Hint domain-containing protein
MGMDTLPQLKDTTNLNTGDDKDVLSDGSSVDRMVVGVTPVDPGGDTGVGSVGLAASADSDGTAHVPGAEPPLPLGSRGGTGASATLGDQPAITDTSGNGLIGASSTASGTLGPLLPDIALGGGPGSGPGPGATTDITTFSGSGIQFSNTFEASVSAAFMANILTAEQDVHNLWTDNVTLTFDFRATSPGQNGQLASNNFFINGFTYSQLRTALQGKSTDSAIALAAFTSLPVIDPAGGQTYWLPINYSNFLGLTSSTSTDTVTLNISYSWNFGQDVVNTMMHEISEGGMGRVGGLGVGLGGRWSTMDLFSYNSLGMRDLSPTDNSRFFSFDGGVTTSQSAGLSYFAANSGGDAADFRQLDVFGTGSPGETNTISTTDINEMDALGWTPSCFCRGTLILTDNGEVPVEKLAIGDKVETYSGAARAIKWIGRRAYDGRFVAGNRDVLPIRVEAGALADGVPARDLYLSPEHALYIDYVLVPAGLLVNGVTIRQVERVERLEYFHIELEMHDVLLAEGAPAETFVDCDNRGMFQNGAEFAALYPDDRPEPWEFCAPRLEAGVAELAAIRAALLERAEALGDRLADDPDLHLIIDGEAVRPRAVAGDVYSFRVPAGSGAIWLASRSAVPAEAEASSQNRRRLGVAVERIVLREDELRIEVGYAHASLREGFHDDEAGYRWTDGMARLPQELLRPFWGEVTVELHLVRPGLRYALDAPAPDAAPAEARRPTAKKRR